MNSKQRIQATIALETADRVPVSPWLDHFAAAYAGVSKKDFILDNDVRFKAVLKTATELGPWDMTYLAENVSEALLLAAPARVRWPGRELDDFEIHQFEEFELLEPDDYDLLCKAGLIRFLREVSRRLYPELGLVRGLKKLLPFGMKSRSQIKALREAGIEPAAGFLHPGPLFEYFSIGRSMGLACMDLYDRPDKVKAAGRVWARALTNVAIRSARMMGVPRIFIGLSRSSPATISPAHFEEFVFPELDHMVSEMIAARITPVFHCDTNWTRGLAVFKRFPPKKCIIELDGATDIFKAKEVLGGHTCIKGDVPAYLTAFKQREDVFDYCRRLVQEVGRDGGFILSTGCSIPANAKPENVRAVFEAAHEKGRG